ncbi:PAS domain S-box protein [Haloarcula marina]|uniref:PAS domain S-box protein n=1 Tax=Haloarcula marina TaxID=2961574 RepID=UPI0020B7D429|nr:PAS domain S-box protein [Halomicroarcula marina]
MSDASLTAALRETLSLFEESGMPQTTTEVATKLDLGRRSTYERLDRLVDRDRLETKAVGANGRVWWRPPMSTGPASVLDRPLAADSLVGHVLDDAEVGVFVLDADFEVAWINEATTRYFGLERAAVLGRDKRTLVEEHLASRVEDGPFPEAVLEAYDDNTYIEGFECRVTAGPGRDERWLEHRSSPIEEGVYEGGRVEVYYDITDRKRTEESLRENVEQFESLVNAVEEYAIFQVDTDGSVQTWNAGAAEIKGYDAEEILGEHFSTFYTEADRDANRPGRNLDAAAEAGVLEEEGWRVRADGSRFWAHVTITPIRDDRGELQGYAKVTRDMTTRRENERARQREHALLERVQEVSPIGIGIFDEDGALQRSNERFGDLLGRDEESLEYQLGDQRVLDADGDVVPPSERPAQKALSTGESVFDQRLYVECSDGRDRWISVNAKPLGGERGGVVATMTDVTRLKEQSDRLERQRDDLESELESVLDRVDDGFFALTEDLRLTYVNDRASDFLGRPASQLVDEHLFDVLELGEDAVSAFETARETQTATSVEAFHDPTERWLELFIYPDDDGLSVYFRDVTERRRRERELERYEQLVETVWDGVYALDEDGRLVLVNEAFCDLVGYERSSLLGNRPEQVVGESVTDLVSCTVDERQTESALETVVETADGDSVPVEARFGPFEYDHGRLGRCGVARDVTERKRFEETLVALYEFSKRLFDAESVTDVDELVVEGVAEVLDLPGVAVYRYDATADELSPVASSVADGFMRGGRLPPVAPDDSSLTGHAYDSREVHAFDDITTSPYLQATETAMRSGVFVPVGDHGVLVAGAPEVAAIDDDTRQLLELLGTNAATAYDRVEREARLREHERRLERQRESLAALNNLHDTVRGITDAVISQSTRAEIEQTVCSRLVESDTFEFAWVGDVDPASQTLNVRAESGVEGYLDEVTVSTDPDEPTGRGPAGTALRTGEMQVTQDVLNDPDFEPWADAAARFGYRSVAAIPLTNDGSMYGMLGLYASRPNTFDDTVRTVVGQLGEIVGHAIAATERKRALTSDEVVELTFQIRDVFDAVDVDASPTGTIRIEHAIPTGDDEFLVFGQADAEAVETLEALVAGLSHWTDLTIRAEAEGVVRYELTLVEPPVLSNVASRGGYVDAARIEAGDYQMVIHLPPGANVREVTDVVQAAYPAADLLKSQQVTREEDTAQRVQSALTDDLTDRQRTTLEAAFHSGFFEWPRDASGEDVADSLGVSAPTFHQHLRKAQRKVLAALLRSSLTE